MNSAALIASAWRTPLGATIDTALARLYAGEVAALDPHVNDPRAPYGFPAITPIRDWLRPTICRRRWPAICRWSW